MARRMLAKTMLIGAGALLLSTAVYAQSVITGTVKDATGAAMPGVTVEAASPVLIEKVKTTVSDSNGNYRITDLRPGTYAVTFTLPGFNTFVRDGLEIQSDFTATLNAELKVGSLEETITVTGESPIVDVSSTARVQVLSREVMDAVPTGRTIYAMAQLVTGVNLNAPDVGGSRAMQQTYMTTRGLTSANNIVQVDGMMINGLDGDGAVQQYVNNQFIQEMTYTTAGAGADVSPGGVRVNIVPKDGGNRYSGTFFGGWNDGAWQSDNMTDKLRARGLRAADRIEKMYEFSGSFGGPIKRDKVWFLLAGRLSGIDAPIADTFYVPSGATQADCQAGRVACEQGIDDQTINSVVGRITWQVTPRNKISVFFEEVDKARGHGMNAGDDPRTASQVWTSPLYNDAALKWTSPISNRLLVEAGFSFNYEEYVIVNQPGVNQERGTDAWYAGASRRDVALGTLRNGFGAGQGGRYPDRYNIQASTSYIIGSHNIKTGFQFNWGPYENTRETNADLQQLYLNGAPLAVVAYNTPMRYMDKLLGDLGIYAQDSWALNRLTLNYGLRWESLSAEVSAATSPAGRFIGERSFDAIPMPVWKDLAPRFGAVYDLFGNAKTALKVGVNRYNESRTTFFANRYNPLALSGASLSWTDLNGDDVAQGERGCAYRTPGCEINFAQLPATFGRAQLNTVDPNFKRVYNVETYAGVQHELLPRVSLSANWYRRTFSRMRITDNLLRTMADYDPINVFNPMTGAAMTIYSPSAAAVSRVNNFDTNAGPERKHVYMGFDLNVNARLPGGGTVFGGFVTERNLRRICDEPDDPNMLLYCDDWQNDIPYRPTLKLAGTYPLVWGISVSATFQSLAGRPLGGFTSIFAPGNKIGGPGYGDSGSPIGTDFLITRTTRYPAACPAPCPAGALVAPTLTVPSITVPLVAPGTEFLPRINQLDLSFAKWFQVGGVRMQGQAEIFNVGNAANELFYRSTNFGTAAYLQPASVLQGRMIRLGVQMKW